MHKLSSGWLVGLYIALAVIWVWLSDLALAAFRVDSSAISNLHVVKDGLFIAFTGAVFYLLMTQRLRAVEESERSYRLALEEAADGIMISDAQGKLLMVNEQLCRMLGYTRDELLRMNASDLLPPDDSRQNPLRFKETIELAGQTVHAERRMLCKDGRIIQTEGRGKMLPNGTLQGIIRDVTEKRREETVLRDEQIFIEQAQEVAHIGRWSSGVELDEPLFWSEEVYRIFGLPADSSLTSETFYARIHADDRETVQGAIEAAIERDERYSMDHRVVRPDGTVRWVFETGEVIRDAEGKPQRFVGVVQDITERKNVEAELMRQKEILQTIFDNIPVLIVFFDAQERIQMVNREWERVMGWTLAEVQNRGFDSLLEELYSDPADRARVVESIGDEEGWLNFRMKLRNGETIESTWMNVSLPDGRNLGIGQNINERVRAEQELRRLNDELEERVAKRTAELRAANERLLELDELRARFVAHVTHELRNPVAGLSMRLYLMQRAGVERFEEHQRVLTDQVERLKNLIDSVLDLSRIELSRNKVIFGEVDFNAVVRHELDALLTHAESTGLALRFTPDDSLPSVWGERIQLAQVVANLVSNGIRYTPSGEIRVQTTLSPDQKWACLRVADTGLGIAGDDLPHLFERFYRGQTATSADIPGTGLGLSIVKEIVDLHGGAIEVESEVGKGTTFRVYFPILERVLA